MIPVVMFHSVGNSHTNWSKKWLSVSLEHFEFFCKYLNEKHFKTIFLNEWYDLVSNPSRIKGNEVVLSFDDGYLDNWVFAFPILKKYALCGTIFINPEFIDNSNLRRPTLEDVDNYNINILRELSIGFLNWNEIKYMDSTDVIDIQSHSMSHDKYFYSNKVIDIYTGQSSYDWLNWIENKKDKPFFLTSKKEHVKEGYPIFENDRSLRITRYFPDPNFIDYAIKSYESQHNLSKKEKIENLNYKIEKYPGHFETIEDNRERYLYEINESKTCIEEKLNKEINFLCWPGGGYNELSITISKEVGFLASTISTKDSTEFDNSKESYKRISRIGMSSFVKTSKALHYVNKKNYLCQVFKGKKGNIIIRNYVRLMKLKYLILDRFIK